MKLIQSGLEYLTILGIGPNQRIFNIKFFTSVVVYATDVGSNWIFLVYEASTFFEYANSIFLTTTVTMVATCFVILSFIRPRVFGLIDLSENQIEKS